MLERYNEGGQWYCKPFMDDLVVEEAQGIGPPQVWEVGNRFCHLLQDLANHGLAFDSRRSIYYLIAATESGT